MEIRSEPVYIEEAVTLIDITFTFGQVSTLTLRGKDRLVKTPKELTVIRESGEVLHNHREHILWWGEKTGTIRTPVTRPDRVNSRSQTT